MPKPHATRTFAPLQFEALEPHRFEDLVRDLIYDYRDWLSIEATGRGGGDDGYDIRAFERPTTGPTVQDEDADDDPFEGAQGRRWMIQCKREKELGPKRVRDIIEDAVTEDDPPFGYVLAAPANFSKKAYDEFRGALSERGVQEFHLFGRAELEDMLYMPKNDRILFAFFGVSLSSRKRTRVSAIRATVNNKNKLYSVLGLTDTYDGELNRSVLLRDTNDTYYPRKDEYPDFDQRPRWKEYIANRFYPDGLRFKAEEYFAYVDREKREWDFAPTIDLIMRESKHRNIEHDARQQQYELRERAQSFWEHLPRVVQGHYLVDGFVSYDGFAFIDKHGDPLFNFPHLYVEFGKRGPFNGIWRYFEIGSEFEGLDGYTRIQVFPKEFPKPAFGTVHMNVMELADHQLYALNRDGRTVVVDTTGSYDVFKARDVFPVKDTKQKDHQPYAEVTHRFKIRADELADKHHNLFWQVERQGQKPEPNDVLDIIELVRVFEHQFAEKHQ